MNIATILGLTDEIFCRMVVTTKMLFSNLLGHVAELHYEKYLDNEGIKFQKAPTDVHYDYTINEERHQVKRFESDTTYDKFIGVNLTKTHGDRSGADAFYERSAFDKLILFDVGFKSLIIIDSKDIPINNRYGDRLPAKFKIPRKNGQLTDADKEFLTVLKIKNVAFPKAIEKLRSKYGWSYQQLLEACCNLTLDEIYSLFTEDNFRLVVGAKGFAAEEHLNMLLDKNGIPYCQNKDMYSKIDHWVKDKIRVQVKIPNEKANTPEVWGVKMHKSHGHGKSELCLANAFDILAFFIGFKMGKSSKYFPESVKTEFIFVPVTDLPQHPEYPGYLKRVCRIKKDSYEINDLSIFS